MRQTSVKLYSGGLAVQGHEGSPVESRVRMKLEKLELLKLQRPARPAQSRLAPAKFYLARLV